MNICSNPSDSSLFDAVRLLRDTHTYILTSSHSLSLSRVCVNVGVGVNGRMDGWMDERIYA